MANRHSRWSGWARESRLWRLAGRAKRAAQRRLLQFGQWWRPRDASDNLDRQVLDLTERIRSNASGAARKPVRLLAFYLPQFHPIPENDAWWGKGFTEWTNVTRAVPAFPGHYQPHRPAELGYYDLRLPEVRERQAELARHFGIAGFCYHYYWFQGRRLLERPIREVLQSRRPAFPFCLCWANEHWTRTWDGSPRTMLLAQEHTPEDDRRFIEHILPALRDERYFRVNGRAVLLVYQAALFPNARQTAEIWRETCARAGVGELFLVAAQTFQNADPRPHGFDAAVEFPPHGCGQSALLTYPQGLHPRFTGQLYDYRQVIHGSLTRPAPEYRLLRGVMPSWDNTARRRATASIWLNSSPELYERWLASLVAQTSLKKEAEERLIFVNAWNEWAEGCHLEPDEEFGYRYLEATRRALLSESKLGLGTVRAAA